MFTNNYVEWLKYYPLTFVSRATRRPVTMIDGTTKYTTTGFTIPSSDLQSGVKTNNTSGVIIGSGTATPTANDYCLESRITSGFSSTITVMKTSDAELDSNGNPRVRLVMTINNIGSSDLTIGEVGLQYYASSSAFYPSQSGGSASNGTVLIERTVLTTPVTIHAGESCAIVYEITVESV